MFRFIAGAFIVLHGLVHLLYVGQSQRRFELRPGMVWPDGSWAFSRLLGEKTTRLLASICYLLSAAGFVVGGVALLAGQAWWRPVAIGSAAFSTASIILFWDGKLKELADQGLIAVLINMAIIVAALIVQ